MADHVTNDQLASDVRHVSSQVQVLDTTVRGNNGEGLVARVARIEEQTKDIGPIRSRVEQMERRIAVFTAGAAAFGACAGLLIEAALKRLVE